MHVDNIGSDCGVDAYALAKSNGLGRHGQVRVGGFAL
jgi:hypothetical protein